MRFISALTVVLGAFGIFAAAAPPVTNEERNAAPPRTVTIRRTITKTVTKPPSTGSSTVTRTRTVTSLVTSTKITTSTVTQSTTKTITSTSTTIRNCPTPELSNGGFEMGQLQPWSVSGNSPQQATVGGGPPNCRTGFYCQSLGGINTFIAQTVNLVPGNSYRFSYWAKMKSGSPCTALSATGTGRIADNVVLDATYKEVSGVFTATDARTDLNIVMQCNNAGSTYVDDATLTLTACPS